MRTGRILAAFAVTFCTVPAVAFASACNEEIVVPIRFIPGSYCWKHAGRGTTFIGQFRVGQKVTATATGEAFFADGPRVVTKVEPWTWSVEGPGNFAKFSDIDGSGELEFVIPQSGRYSFTVFPCAIWGNRGNVAICAR